MASNLSDSAKRVQDYLLVRGFSFEVKELPGSTRTAQEAADSIGCAVAQIAKSLVYRDKETGLPAWLELPSPINNTANFRGRFRLKAGWL